MKVVKDLYKVFQTPRLQKASLLVGWKNRDAGKVGREAVSFLIKSLDCYEIAEMELLDFFSFEGAVFQDNIIQVPDSRFWACEKHNLLLFLSDEPVYEHYAFLKGLLDFGEFQCQVKELYTVNGAPGYIYHGEPRPILSIFNRTEMQGRLKMYRELEPMDWEGNPGLSTYLLWAAKRRGLAGVSLWPEVPFYLAPLLDPWAVKAALAFLDRRLELGLNLSFWDQQVQEITQKITRFQEESPKVGKLIHKVEKQIALTEKEQIALSSTLYNYFI